MSDFPSDISRSGNLQWIWDNCRTWKQFYDNKAILTDGSKHHDGSDQWPWIQDFDLAERNGLIGAIYRRECEERVK